MRQFHVTINGNPVLTNFDIFATAGAMFKAVIKQFQTTPDSNGGITVAFTYGATGNPLLNGLEVIP